MKAFIDNYIVTAAGTSYVGVTFIDENSGNAFVDNVYIASNFSADTSSETIFAQAKIDIQTYANSKSYGTVNTFGMFATTNANPPVGSVLGISLVTGTGAVGTQISSTQASWVAITGSVSTTATIGGASSGDIIIEVAPTNSATSGDWVEWGRIGNSQTISLALALNSVQVTKGQVMAFLPIGYWVKARTNGSGTVSYSLLDAKQILL